MVNRFGKSHWVWAAGVSMLIQWIAATTALSQYPQIEYDSGTEDYLADILHKPLYTGRYPMNRAKGQGFGSDLPPMLPWYFKMKYAWAPNLSEKITNPGKFYGSDGLFNPQRPRPMLYPDPMETFDRIELSPIVPRLIKPEYFQEFHPDEGVETGEPLFDIPELVLELPEDRTDREPPFLNQSDQPIQFQEQPEPAQNAERTRFDRSDSTDPSPDRVNGNASLYWSQRLRNAPNQSRKNSPVQILYAQGTQALENRNYRSAYLTFQRLVDMQPNSIHSQFRYGLTCFYLNKYAEAEQAIRKAFEMSNQKQFPYPSLWDLNLHRHDFSREYKKLNRYALDHPDDTAAHELLRFIYASSRTD